MTLKIYFKVVSPEQTFRTRTQRTREDWREDPGSSWGSRKPPIDTGHSLFKTRKSIVGAPQKIQAIPFTKIMAYGFISIYFPILLLMKNQQFFLSIA